jgi:hypothetical protein
LCCNSWQIKIPDTHALPAMSLGGTIPHPAHAHESRGDFVCYISQCYPHLRETNMKDRPKSRPRIVKSTQVKGFHNHSLRASL